MVKKELKILKNDLVKEKQKEEEKDYVIDLFKNFALINNFNQSNDFDQMISSISSLIAIRVLQLTYEEKRKMYVKEDYVKNIHRYNRASLKQAKAKQSEIVKSLSNSNHSNDHLVRNRLNILEQLIFLAEKNKIIDGTCLKNPIDEDFNALEKQLQLTFLKVLTVLKVSLENKKITEKNYKKNLELVDLYFNTIFNKEDEISVTDNQVNIKNLILLTKFTNSIRSFTRDDIFYKLNYEDLMDEDDYYQSDIFIDQMIDTSFDSLTLKLSPESLNMFEKR